MNKTVRRLMSGASLAVLSLGVPGFARVATARPTHLANPNVIVNGASTAVDVGGLILVEDIAFAESRVGFGPNGALLRDPEANHLPPLTGATGANHHTTNIHNTSSNTVRRRFFRSNTNSFNAAVLQNATGTPLHLGATNNLINTSEAIIEGIVHNFNNSSAHATAVRQFAGVYTAHNFFSDQGPLVGAEAVGHTTVSAVAVSQIASAPYGAHNRVVATNGTFGTIIGIAHAVANATDHHPDAHAWGIKQNADPAYTAQNSVVNSDLIAALATAHGGSNPGARAIAISQNVDGNAYSAHATNRVTNNFFGDIVAVAHAATGLSHVHATATGVNQGINSIELAGKNTVHNHGLIFASASARVGGGSGFDEVSAIAKGVNQIVGDAYSAQNLVHNTGTIAAIAHAASGLGEAFASVHGINQSAYSADFTIRNDVVNKGFIVANASARSAETARASADAVDQLAFTAPYGAKNTVSNTGHGVIGALAVARFASRATASARGVTQSADNGSHRAANLVRNSRYAAIVAIASASNGESSNLAHARAVNQFADGATATNVVTNNGLIAAGAFAHGNTFLGNVADEAHATATGVRQVATGFPSAKNTVNNDAHGIIAAFASASFARSFTSDNNVAKAVGVEQSAIDSINSKGRNVVNNSGLIAATARAHGTSSNSSNPENKGVRALAIATGVGQDLDGFVTANNIVNNYAAGHILAHATASYASKVTATAFGVKQDRTGGTGALAKNAVLNIGHISATAKAHGTAFFGSTYVATTAKAHAVGVQQNADPAVHAVNSVANPGVIHAVADASFAFYTAVAKATGVGQDVHAFKTALNKVVNRGNISATAFAGIGTSDDLVDHARATAHGITQANSVAPVLAGGNALNSVQNYSQVHANATASSAFSALAHADGVHQHAAGYSAVNFVVNSVGTISAVAVARGTGGDIAGSFAEARATGVAQSDNGHFAKNTVINHGKIHASASAVAGEFADGVALGVAQFAGATYTAHNLAKNFGTISATAHAGGHASGLYAAETEGARATAIDQGAEADGHASNIATNDPGRIIAHAFASGTHATATAKGVNQGAFGVVHAHDFAKNSGLISALASAEAEPVYTAHAQAFAAGIEQAWGAANASITAQNFGTIDARAVAEVFGHGHYSAARATAIGIDEPHFGVKQAPNVVNDGNIIADATAVANKASAYTAFGIGGNTFSATGAHARAFGIRVSNDDFVGGGAGKVVGTVSNQVGGFIGAEAFGVGPNAHATAVGIGVEAYAFGGLIVNQGTVDAQAFGVHARAIGIGVTNVLTSHGHRYGAAAVSRLTGTIENIGGMVFASTGKGAFEASFGEHTEFGVGVSIGNPGTAIEVENAPNKIHIFLEGGGPFHVGEIYGNIEDAENPANWTNTITVLNGKSYLDGSVNPELNPASVPSLANGGSLTINANGTLWLSDKTTSFWGKNPAVNVATFSQAGTLEVNVGSAAIDSATINANTAALGGTLLVNPNPFSLFGNSTTYTIVNSPNAGISGSWTLANANSSPLFTLSDSISSTTATVTLNRVAFDLVAGLTPNEEAVADGLENAYPTVLGGGGVVPSEAKLLYASIFQLTPAQYPAALNMLSDVYAGELAQRNVLSVKGFDDRIDDRLATIASIFGAGGEIGKRSDGVTLWGEPFGTWTNTGSTISGPGYHDSVAGGTIGADYAFDNASAILGVAGNWESNASFNFENGQQWNSLTGCTGVGGLPPGSPNCVGGNTVARGRASGWDVAVYGRLNADLDDNAFYIQAKGSYGHYTDRLSRWVALPLFGSQGCSEGPPSPIRECLYPNNVFLPAFARGQLFDKFGSNVWSIEGEAGLPLVQDDWTITPFIAGRYIDSTSNAYNETGSVNTHTAANLHVQSADGRELKSFLGAEFSTTWNIMDDQELLPSLRLAWEHNFVDPWKVNAYFADVGPASAFTVNGSSWSKDGGLVDFAISSLFYGNLLATVGYNGNLNKTQIAQTVYGRLDIKFGEAPPPPPPPPPAAPPPPPPPPPPVKTFIVFFDFDKSNLTAEAQSVVEQAVKTAKENGFVKVMVTGHTDTVGSDRYNQALSERRAEAVKDEMVREGMDGNEIAIAGKSFHDPLVPTGPGVREPQNRRAVIDLGPGANT